LSGLPPAPATTIKTVFSQVDQIAARLQILSAQAPTYAQFNVTLGHLSNQISQLQQQFVAFQDQIVAILELLQAILELAPTFGTLLNQELILQSLVRIEQALGSVPKTPTQIGVDFKNVETEPQKPAKIGVRTDEVTTEPQKTPVRRGP
jgi:uncharacterized phage infection (PIP) family protein YhgE